MEFFPNVTKDDLKKAGIPTFNNEEHYLIKPQPKKEQTIVIELENNKYMTVCVMPGADCVDVKVHGEHAHSDLGEGLHTFFRIKNENKDNS